MGSWVWGKVDRQGTWENFFRRWKCPSTSLLVSGPAYKIRSHHSMLATSPKLNRQKSIPLLRSDQEVRSHCKLLPPKLKRQKGGYRKLQLTWARNPEAEPQQEPVQGRRKTPNCNQHIAGGSVWTSVGVQNSRGTPSWVLPGARLCAFYLLEVHRVLPKSIRVPLTEGGEKEPLWSVSAHSVLKNKVCPQEKLRKESVLLHLVLSAAKLTWGKRSAQPQPPPAIPFHLRARREWEALVKVIVKRHSC